MSNISSPQTEISLMVCLPRFPLSPVCTLLSQFSIRTGAIGYRSYKAIIWSFRLQHLWIKTLANVLQLYSRVQYLSSIHLWLTALTYRVSPKKVTFWIACLTGQILIFTHTRWEKWLFDQKLTSETSNSFHSFFGTFCLLFLYLTFVPL